MITPEMRADLAECVLCWLATLAPDGRPGVSPKEVFCVLDATRLAIADIASAGSVRNLRANPAACVTAVDVFRQKGWRLDGEARVLAPGNAGFDLCAASLRPIAGTRFAIRHVLVLSVQRVAPVIAPSYRLTPAPTEAEMQAQAHARYGVRPLA